ncbi:DUF4062 domain-containing protein [Aeromonas jandaei]|uniref:DUF4062 domain-containing protein n=1 Tax=Aeromonas jandaei TaxID=650 RepID=UPI003BA316F7
MKTKKYQVFLSSTYSDLVDEREGIIKAILELYHIPIGMEMFSAEDEDQWEIIRRTIEVSDYYILVLGLRYGSKTSSGISFTQKEYEYALARKIPILAFVMNDTVSLSKDKRDDDLSDINNFRKMVLTNFKMAQFWETKDQLIKSVSISLMKQIMQKPAIGWIRGDSVSASEDLSKELSVLSKENRELREKLIELESKLSPKRPDIDIKLSLPDIGADFYAYQKVEMPKQLNINDIEAHLLDYISPEDIDGYNKKIPGQDELERYNNECERIYRIKECSTPLVINVSNNGTTKANNIYIDIKFSDGLYVYENEEITESIQSPIPFNPLVRAAAEYETSKRPKISTLGDLVSPLGTRNGFFRGIPQSKSMFGSNKLISFNEKRWTKLNGNKITIRLDSLIHTRHTVFDDEYMIVPLKSGSFYIDISIICEEYVELDYKRIEFKVENSGYNK